ncbi:MAG: glucose-6-phosphate isomerase [Gammaproteobacteria bacterium]|nr:glucose-6-phosphate isomerase [Gammaproteobacteria bacterium]
MNNRLQNSVWQKLLKHYQKISMLHLRDLFRDDPKRFDKFSLQASHIFVDYSKNRITQETLNLLIQLAQSVQLKEKIEAMFKGAHINTSENRAALHTALRNQSDQPLLLDGLDIMPQIRNSLLKMRRFVEDLRCGNWRGFTQKSITDVVNIGVGGSDLGTKMATHALAFYADHKPRCHFVSNVDAAQIMSTLKSLDPETTLFIIASKSFTSIETITNANTAKTWLLKTFHDPKAIQNHFVAISAHPEKAIDFGIHAANVFEFWDYVGGRYSLWSAIGLPIALAIGMDSFEQMLKGAFEMDQHFRLTDFSQNAPVLLALLSIWYRNFFNTASHAIIPYSHDLRFLPDYLQQLEMESNGKSVQLDGAQVNEKTADVTWGGVGINGQHAFHQLLHQGTDFIPIDFIVAVNSLNPVGNHHELLLTNCLAQSEALLCGKTFEEAYKELIEQNYTQEEAEKLAPHKVMPGNRPSNTLVLEKLTPESLGALIALYEHKTFVQGVIWNIDSFDQWGVELGKKLAKNMINDLGKQKTITHHDSSTTGLLNYYRTHTTTEV